MKWSIELLGAHGNLSIIDGSTPLYIALEKSYLDVARILIESGADMNIPGKNGWTQLHVASRNDHFNMVKLLIEYGAIM